MTSHTQTGKIRVQMWSLLEQEPQLLQDLSEQTKETNSTKQELSKDFFYQYSVNEIKNLAPFVFEGIIHGWNFSYTPYDKTRNVNEYFEFSVDGPNISKNDKNIKITWAFTQPQKYNIENIIPIRYYSLRYFYELATSKVIITNYRLPEYFKKRKKFDLVS